MLIHNEKILITGITGFIGSNLARHFLKDGFEVCGMVREPVNERYIGDIESELDIRITDGSYESIHEILDQVKPSIVFHLATYYTGQRGQEHIKKLVESNICFGAYILDAMVDAGCTRIVNVSSIMAYYDNADYCPINLYSATKQAFADLIEYYAENWMIKAISLVLPDTYGPGDMRPKILNLIRQAVEKKEHISLTKGDQVYDALHIEDVVSALLIAGMRTGQMKGGHDFFQIYSGEIRSLREVVNMLLEVKGWNYIPGWGELQATGKQQMKPVRRFPILPGWKAKIDFMTGLVGL